MDHPSLYSFHHRKAQIDHFHPLLKWNGFISGVCDHCVTAFGVEKDLVRKEGLPLVSQYNGHPIIAKLVSSGFQIITL